MDGIPTVLLGGHINALARLLHKHSKTSFVSLIILWVMDGIKIHFFWEDLWLANNFQTSI